MLSLAKPQSNWDHARAVADYVKRQRLTLVNSKPQVPLDAMEDNSVLWSWAEANAEHYEAPIQFWWFSLLTALSPMISRQVTIQSGVNAQLQLYTLLLGEAGASHKSFAATRSIGLLQDAWEIEDSSGGFHVLEGAGSGEGLAEALAETPTLLTYADEFKTLLSKMRIENSVLEPMLTALYERRRFQTRTRGRNIDINDASLSLLACTTLDQYDGAHSNIGLETRLSIVYGEGRRKPIPGPFDPILTAMFTKQVQAITDHIRRPRSLSVTPAAGDELNEWYIHRLPNDQNSKRIDNLALRFAGLLSVVNGHTSIDMDTMQRGIALAEYIRATRVYFSSATGAETKEAEAENHIIKRLRRHGTPVTYSEAQRLTNGARKYGLERYKKAWANLAKNGDLINQDGKWEVKQCH